MRTKAHTAILRS